MNLLFTINKGFMEHLDDCVRSIIRFPSEGGYDIYVIHSDLDLNDQKQLERYDKDIEGNSVAFHFIDMKYRKDMNFPETDRYPMEIYYRIYASALLPETLDRILYLDADIIVIRSLKELYEMDFEDNYFLACTHIRKFLNKMNRLRLGIEEKVPYINTGVILMNLDVLRKKQDFHEVGRFVEEHRKTLTLPDQDIIAALYGTHIGLIDTMRYNLSDRMIAFYNMEPNHEKIDRTWVRENAVILHYCGKQKPWNKNYVGILDAFYHELKDEEKLQVKE